MILKQGGGAVERLSEALTIDRMLEQCDQQKKTLLLRGGEGYCHGANRSDPGKGHAISVIVQA